MSQDLTVKKLNLLFIPFLLISISICAVYTFLNWLLIIKFELFSVREDLVEIIVPLVLPVIVYFLFFRARIRILNLKTDINRLPVFYFIMLWIALSIPNIIIQGFLPKAVGKLTHLHGINEIDSHKPSKYYSLNQFAIDKKNVGINAFYDISGKNNTNYDIYIYVVFPMITSGVNNVSCKAFLGVKYFKSISNKLSAREKQDNFDALASISNYEIEHNSFDDFSYLERIGNTNDTDGYKDAILHCSKYDRSIAPVLIAHKEPFGDRLHHQSIWIFISFIISGAIWLIMVLIPEIDAEALKRFS
ncbi:hypothetical protein [Pedobacter sp. UBA5917]|jgi:hypothetical protein|uniref:hypothetical protein n=1 Tax=Pedobacter sp. UBA5917 TaxID=1947061 RepID=UPI0025F2CA34|nr:hypothetical protein [Pedobacter sp. UBA5917]